VECVLADHLPLPVATLMPRVEDPWPDSIGLEFPVGLAAAFAVMAGVVKTGASKADRDRAISQAGLTGFLLGAGLYLVALVIQIGSAL
jgi:hypothetical protein